MSVTTRPQHQQREQDRETEKLWQCNYCDDNSPAQDFYSAGMCSEECERRDRAETLFNVIQNDHRLCFSCGAQLKTIERPPEDVSLVIGPCRHDAVPNTARDVLAGYEYHTRNAIHGDISLDIVDDPDADGRPLADRVGNGVICQCGATDHRDADSAIRGRFALEVAHNIQEAVEELRTEGKTDEQLDHDRHFDALIEGESHLDALANALIL